MSITEPLVLPVDVTLVPVARLAASVQARLSAREGEYAVTRPRGRARAKLISAQGAALLEEFRSAKRVADAVIAIAGRGGLDPERVLQDAFPLLRDCFNGGFLVPASSPEAAPILSTRERGDRIGRFEVLRCVQLRDDTELYQASDRNGGLVALKLARPGAAGVTGMLDREAAALAQLEGHGVPLLVARGRHRSRPWLATSWCAGVSPQVAFTALRERDDPASRRKLRAHAGAIVRAYARLHARGILHGDVHPDNLLIGRRGEVTLLDFGLAVALPPLRLAGRAPRGGVPPYLPPEHAKALLEGNNPPAPTALSEQYAVGAVLYALFTGQPYTDFALERTPMLEQIVERAPLPFTRRGVSPWASLERVLARALEKDAAARFSSLRAFATALERATARKIASRSAAAANTVPSDLIEDFLSQVHFTAPAFREWPKHPTIPPPTASVMFGAAGVAYALYRLACVRDDAAILAVADAWLTRAERASDSRDAFTAAGTDLSLEALGPVSPFHSVTGVHLVRALLALTMGDRRSAERAAAQFVEIARIPWHQLDLTLGRTGVLLGCALLLEALAAGGAKTEAVLELGKHSLEELWATIDGYGPIGRESELESPGIAHGWAGMLYASLRWCDAGGGEIPPGLPARLAQLAARAEPLGRGVHWPRAEIASDTGARAPDMISGWCNGPAGFVHLWTLAHERYGRSEYLALAEACGWSAWDGRAMLPDLCCGLAGRGYGLLNLYKHTGKGEWLERARQLGQRAARNARRSSAQRPLSLFKGVPGIALLLADLVRPEGACMPCFEPEGWPAATGGHD